ncbi:hypothetical protein [Thiocystis violacea]|uniref:hypothetical protein n=1 Tax=Thiocystis violacea TaxID=13725 RepID=UPI001907F44A|nr:hypothetical protein [Thiocystis violacea]MBK1725263.1 hypothetical protein [Thiocystis violacea]
MCALNQRSREILSANAIPWSPRIELASLALIRDALDRGALDCHRAIQEPELLLAKLQARPEEAMRLILMTENELGEPFEIDDLDDDPIQAAAQLLEEIVASIRAFRAIPC